MAGDGRIDGKMTVQRGQGISQVIKEELGLTQAECNKLGRSVWSQIFAKVEEENSKHKIYDKKIGEGANVNYLIHPDQVIEFSKEVWSQIVNLVNTKLGKNITSAENEAPPAAEDVDAPEAAAEAPATDAAEETPEASDTEQPAKTPEEEGKEIAQELRSLLPTKSAPLDFDSKKRAKELLKSINSGNVLSVIKNMPDIAQRIDNVDQLGFGWDKKEVYEYVLKPLQEKAGKYVSYSGLSEKSSLKDMKKAISALSSFAQANDMLEEVANMNPKPEVYSGTADEYDWKQIKLSDGRYIKVEYDKESGEITEIRVSYDTTPNTRSDGSKYDGAEVNYTKDEALYDTDKSNDVFDASITSGYEFEKLKALVEQILG